MKNDAEIPVHTAVNKRSETTPATEHHCLKVLNQKGILISRLSSQNSIKTFPFMNHTSLSSSVLLSPIQPAKLCGLILRSQLIVLLKHKVTAAIRQRRWQHLQTRPRCGSLNAVGHSGPCSVLAGVRGVGPVPAHPEEAPAEGLQGRISPLPPDPEHPRLPGREGVYDGPH